MLNIAPIRPADITQSLYSTGGFSWWYADMVDEHGNGIVLIWFFGLPFLPGSKDYKKPIDRPGICLAVYREGVQVFYSLQEYSQDQVQFDGAAEWRFGDTCIRFEQCHDQAYLHVDLRLSVPGFHEFCTGSVSIEGTPCNLSEISCKTSYKTDCKTSDQSSDKTPDKGPHLWSPRMVATTGSAQLRYGDEVMQLHGRAYFDGNTSTVPLDKLGIARWRWGRLALPDRELIYYLVDAADPGADEQPHWAISVDAAGRMSRHRITAIEERGERRSWYGPRYHRSLRLRSDDGVVDVSVRYSAPAENGPFYLRFLIVGHCHRSGERAAGVAELLLPEKVDVAWQRPFVRMRHHAVGARNSIWLPLFNGPRRTRLRRLLRGFVERLLPGRALPPAQPAASQPITSGRAISSSRSMAGPMEASR